MEREKERETVLVPLRRHEAMPKKELSEEPPEPYETEIWEMPKRWNVY
jgi:hypothetical protein